ncbi:MAG: hypothetical protein ACLFM3_01165 [Desulfohalobiaceae bacterium]
MQNLGLQRLMVGGLALDVCVRASVLNSLQLKLMTYVILSCTKAVSNAQGQEAKQQMQGAAAVLHP